MKQTTTKPPIDILFEDNHLLVVNKPGGVLSQADHSGKADLLSLCGEYIKKEYQKPGNVFLGLVHRLDQPVSGVMVLAKTSKAASRLSEQVRTRKIKKAYLTIVNGTTPPNAMLHDYLYKDNQTNTVHISNQHKRGAKEAILTFETVSQNQTQSLLQVQLKTGRPHQIRVQLSSAGFPIVGDHKYGSTTHHNIALHAFKLGFEHPTLKKYEEFIFPPVNTIPWSSFWDAIKEI